MTMIDRAFRVDPDEANDSHSRPASRFTVAAPRFVAYSILGICLGLVAMLIVMRQAHYDPTPSLSPEQLHAAHEHWKAHKIPSYDIEVKVSGPQAAVYRVEVRKGDAVAAWRNGQALQSHRTFGTWSIPGMFATISRDVEAMERAAAANKQPPLILRAAFHPEYGYPERYRRIDNGSRKGSDSIAVMWDVTSFRLIDEPKSEN